MPYDPAMSVEQMTKIPVSDMLTRLGRWTPNQQRLLLIALCIVFYFVWVTRVPLTEVDEARFCEATRYMLVSHDYLIPHFNGEPRYQKPILYYWLQLASLKLFGVNEVAARLPSAIAVTLLVLLLHGFLLRWLLIGVTDEKEQIRRRGAALLGAVALASIPLLSVWARAAVTDAVLSLCITVALLSLVYADYQGQFGVRHSRRWHLLAMAAIGASMLTKGPVGLVVPAGVWLVYHLYRRTLRNEMARVPWVAGILVFLLIAAPWYLATYLVDGPIFLKHFFLEENLHRFTATNMNGHGMSNHLLGLFTYLPVLLVLAYPYIAVLPFDFPCTPPSESLRRLRTFAWCWLAVTVGIFSLSRTQLPSYIQSVSAAIAILFTLQLLAQRDATPRRQPASTQLRQQLRQAATYIVLTIPLLIWIGVPVWLLSHGALSGPLGSMPFPRWASSMLIGLLVCAGAILLIVIIRDARYPSRLVLHMMPWWIVVQALLLLGVLPLLVRSAYGPSAEIGQYLHTLTAEDRIFSFCPMPSESLVYYAQRQIDFYDMDNPRIYQDLLQAYLRATPVVVITDADGANRLQTAGDSRLLRQFGEIRILRFGESPSLRDAIP